MKDKFESQLQWGASAISLVMKNNLVVSATFLITGVFHLLMPGHSLLFDARIMTVLIALYALVSLIFVLTNNQKAEKGQEIAGNIVKGYFEGKREDTVKQEEMFKTDVSHGFAEKSNQRIDKFAGRVTEKHTQAGSVSRVLMLIFYLLILAASVFLFIRNDVAVYINHFILGFILIVDGALRLICTVAAKAELKFRYRAFHTVLSVISVILGLLFIFVPTNTGLLAMQIVSVLMIVKSVGEFFVAFRNREILSSVTDTLTQIKQQRADPEQSDQ